MGDNGDVMRMEISLMLDAFGDPFVVADITGPTKGMTPGDAEKLASYLMKAAAAARLRADMFRKLITEGWGDDDARIYIASCFAPPK